MKDIRDFVPNQCSIKVKMTVILRLKFTGIPNMQKVMNYVSTHLKCIVNGVDEEKLSKKSHLHADHHYIESADWERGSPKDMI